MIYSVGITRVGYPLGKIICPETDLDVDVNNLGGADCNTHPTSFVYENIFELKYGSLTTTYAPRILRSLNGLSIDSLYAQKCSSELAD